MTLSITEGGVSVITEETMNKQIPEKILFARNMMTKECCFACPRCNRKVESAHTHCWNCGQKLDWGDAQYTITIQGENKNGNDATATYSVTEQEYAQIELGDYYIKERRK